MGPIYQNHLSPAQMEVMQNFVRLQGFTSAALFALMGIAILLLHRSVTRVSWRKTAFVIACIATVVAAFALFNNLRHGYIIGLNNIVIVINLYYMYDLYESQGVNYVFDNTKKMVSILTGVNELLAVLSLIGALTMR